MVATYRLQLRPEFTFSDARAVVPYLRDLGISHLYLSPIMQARSGSTHGYDVVDPTQVSTALGGEAGLRELADDGLPLIVDIVPNHMAACDENPFWRDLELRARFFDLDPHGGHRRFFDVDDLAGVRMEDPEVFAVTHAKLIELVRDGVVAGVRVDHIDGLANPAAYLQRLRAAGIELVWVEKILEAGEALPPWPVAGTTGYEFLVDADALFVDPPGRPVLDALAGFDADASEHAFAELAATAKREQVATTFQPELERLRRVAALPDLDDALAALPVYRTYVQPGGGPPSDSDREAIAALPPAVADAFLGRTPVPDELIVRFQQTSGAVMAKGVEDTAMYRHVRLLSANEVGGQPDRFGLDLGSFHATNAARHARWPYALLAATTHDTKRSADVRARIGALAGMASAWRDEATAMHDLVDAHRRSDAPDALEERFVLQTLVGAWPISDERLTGYLEKALREAKRNTSWIAPDAAWERGVIDTTLALAHDPRFVARIEAFVERVDDIAQRIAIGQTVLRATVPGVPDVYQGDELWNYSLVDPDNRRPVEFEARRAALSRLRGGNAPNRETAKLFALATLLTLRARHTDFPSRPYAPIEAGRDICAFSRGADIVVVVPVRADIELPPREALDVHGEWADRLAPLDAAYGTRRAAVFERLD